MSMLFFYDFWGGGGMLCSYVAVAFHIWPVKFGFDIAEYDPFRFSPSIYLYIYIFFFFFSLVLH